MSSKNFWGSWPLQIKTIYWILLFIAFISLSFFAFTYFSGYDLVIDWKKSAYFEQIPMLLDQFSAGTISTDINADNLLIMQRFEASPLNVNVDVIIFFLIIISIGFIFLLSVGSYLPRLWFFIAMGIWIIILSNLRLELLRLGGSPGYLPLFIIGGLTVLPAYYFNRINKKKSFILRLLVFFGAFTISAVIFSYFSALPHPFIYIASNALIPMLLLTILFIFIVSHEIIAAFIFILTSTSTPGSKNHVHFLIITLIYLINLVILYLNHTGKINWDIWTINPYLLLCTSAILGTWGFRRREVQYQHVISFAPLGAFFYAASAIIAFGTMAFFLGTANDPALEVVKSGIIYGHLGYGLIFLLYILANFSSPLARGARVNQILYKPQQMPYFMFRFAGLVAVFAFALVANWEIPLQYTFAAYFNQQGDLAQVNNEPVLQQGYYQQSRIYAFQNHHANYSLANFYEERDEVGSASAYYLNATYRKPSPQAYVNLSNLYLANNRYFDALFALQESLGKFESGPIYNNLALLYSRTSIIDSAFYYLKKANNYGLSEDAATANMEAIAAANGLSDIVDSLDIEGDEENIVALNNKIVRYNQLQRHLNYIPSLIANGDSLNFFAAGLTYNYLLNTIFHKDTTGISEIIKASDKYKAGLYREKIIFGQAVSEYYHHNVQDGFRKLNALANQSYSEADKYFTTLGQWALEQDVPDQAAEFFRLARLNGAAKVAWLEALSRAMNNQADSALQIIQQFPPDSSKMNMIREMATAERNGSDKEKFSFISYSLSYYDTMAFHEIQANIEDPTLRANAILNYSKNLFEHGLTATAIDAFGLLANLAVTDKKLYNDILYFELDLMAATGRVRDLAQRINDQNIEFTFEEFPKKVFYTAILNAASGDSTSALKNFRWLAANQPFNSFEIVTATDYIKSYSNERYEVYNLLLNALELNPKSIRLLKAYALEAARLGLDSYAANALEDIQKLLTPAYYARFQSEYNEVLSKALQN